MNFVKAQQLLVKPFIAWYSIKNFADGDPLVIPESGRPENIFGVCPWKIVEGELVDRTTGEMEAFELEYLSELALRTDERKIDNVRNLNFNYEGKYYPMNETARLYYHAIQNYTTGTHVNVRSLTGVESIAVADISAFLEDYYKTIAGTLEPTI
jgi:hypothetical protein